MRQIDKSRRRPWNRCVLLFAACFLACFSAFPAAAEEPELLVVGAHFERVFEQARDGRFVGMGPELVRSVAQRMGYRVKFQIYPWARAQAMVAQGLADILVGPYRSSERLATLAFSERAFYQDEMVFYARSGAATPWSGDFAALRDTRIVILNGWAYGPDFERARPQLRVSVTNAVENGLKMLTSQHVDLFATNRRNTEPVIARLRIDGAVAPLPGVIAVQNGYFAFPKRPESDRLRSQFNQVFNALVDSGELKRLGQQLDVGVP
ncbi:substrate-binding periplasmic protein [Janthinobacterium fluminis]|uniref:Transporter substrate-binding domain-containing protein n=1 Tax=Janthinobacterium fluminis TaxID=2987524 RepID=A0ABT5JWN7_9BURK|nr:transporter substrate-binding domain-containing protein [Janthinobacterium fluminis]MDC8756825.1 transporter substrate-binding domain-containing protein [Janthinobacterium fluminis]